MIVEEGVSLAGRTTLRVGGPADFLVECTSEEEIEAAIALAQSRGIPLSVLGEGSNTLAPDSGFRGLVLVPAINGIEFEDGHGGTTLVTLGSGVSWEELVREAATQRLWGVENMAGIPGLVGAAPVQNIGAYGSELSQVFQWCDALPREGGPARRFTATDAAFAYRDSIFKRSGEWIITRVALRLRASGAPSLGYKDLAGLEGKVRTPGEVGEAVRAIRAKKFPDLSSCGTAGSFFKNPILPSASYAALIARYPGLPGFPSGETVKVPLAWILDHVLSLKGFKQGRVRLFENQPLVLVTEAGATAKEVEEFADTIAQKVFEATGITIEREVQTIF